MIRIRSYKLKLKPNKQQLQKLNNYFYEAKCLYNYVLSQEDVFKFDTKVKNMILLGQELTEFKLVENKTSTSKKFLEASYDSKKQEDVFHLRKHWFI